MARDTRSTLRARDEPTVARRGWIALAVVVVVVMALALSRPGSQELATGPSRLPDFETEPLDGGVPMSATSWVGEPVLVNLWASWCAPCVEELPALERFAREHPDDRVVGIAVRDTRRAAARFAADAGVTYELGFDASGAVARQFGLEGLPGTYGFGHDGQLVWGRAGQVDEHDLGDLSDAFMQERRTAVGQS